MCAVDPAYVETLSEASRVSLQLQGGPMSAEEAAEFEANEWHRDAVRLRRWDDEGKKDVEVPGLTTYAALIDGLVSKQPVG
jgi:gamma-butyrobetaine dioxygenase